jgi:hypothetical protein
MGPTPSRNQRDPIIQVQQQAHAVHAHELSIIAFRENLFVEDVSVFISLLKYKYITLLSSIKSKKFKNFQNVSELSARHLGTGYLLANHAGSNDLFFKRQSMIEIFNQVIDVLDADR